ncbi:MAG: ABC transporter permease [Chloroflexi bacterium]|nr:ABC transporter permease [Chloroflexota bacterium]
MRQYLVSRVLLLVPTLFIISVMVFAVVRLFPGDVLDFLTAEANVSREDVDKERERLGLMKPLHEQYLTWVGSMLRGDFGRSLWTKRPVATDIQRRLPVTVELGILSLFFSVVIGIPIGILSAVRQDSSMDYAARSVAIFGLSVPGFWLATMLILFLSVGFHWLPPLRYASPDVDPWQNIQQFIAPAFILGLHLAAVLMRMTRTALLEVLRQDYIRTAWAKGLRERVILARHAFRNSLIPVVTILGLQVALLIGGSVIMESIFNLPGLGQYIFQVILVRDYPAIQAVNLLLASFVMVANLLVDVSLAYIDPRILYR